MKQLDTNHEFSEADDMNNIIRINNSNDTEDEQDFDFDYDPNEMYYALHGKN